MPIISDLHRARCGAEEEVKDAPSRVAITEADIENMGKQGLLINEEDDNE